MTTPAQRLLLSLRDFIGDALSEPDITPADIIEAIRDELKELQDYHKVQGVKINKMLAMLNEPEDVIDFNDYLTNNLDQFEIAEDLDRAINYYKGNSPDVIKFDEKNDNTNPWNNAKNRFRNMGDK